MSKIDEKKARKKDALYSAAFDLFTNKGASETSISDIVKAAGVAKGTFYLYFKDKYDIRNRLVARKAAGIFSKAGKALAMSGIDDFEEQVIFLLNHIIDQLNDDHNLVLFISRNLSWGLFKNAITEDGVLNENYSDVYDNLIEAARINHEDPEIMIYMIVEFINSTIYSSILASDPVDIETLKPYLFRTVRLMLNAQKIQ